jgi:hypothetical protein
LPEKVIDEDASCVKNHQLLSHLPLPADRPSLEERGRVCPYRVRGKAEVLEQLALDIGRLSLKNQNLLIIDGIRYGIPHDHEDRDQLAKTQAEELYNQVRELIGNKKQGLSDSVLDATTTRVVEQLHQGGLAPLLAKLHLSLTDKKHLLTTPYAWKIELKDDRDKGIILEHQVVMELADEKILTQRQQDHARASYDSDRLPRYQNPIHKGEGFVFASSQLLPLEEWMGYRFKMSELE